MPLLVLLLSEQLIVDGDSRPDMSVIISYGLPICHDGNRCQVHDMLSAVHQLNPYRPKEVPLLKNPLGVLRLI